MQCYDLGDVVRHANICTAEPAPELPHSPTFTTASTLVASTVLCFQKKEGQDCPLGPFPNQIYITKVQISIIDSMENTQR